MRIFGRNLSVKSIGTAIQKALAPVYGGWGGGWNSWYPVIDEPFTGAWQRNMSIRAETGVEHFAVYACVSRISSDIGKLPWLLLKKSSDEQVWERTKNPAYDGVLKRPNRYQNHIEFKQFWLVSKLLAGNTYILKERDNRGVVKALYILDPNRVTPLVADDGSIFYRLQPDNLSSLGDIQEVVVPASEIIHDRCMPIFHPLIGVAPMVAYAHAVCNGLEIQKQATLFWANAARPSGIITAPGKPTKEQAEDIKAKFETFFKGQNVGKIAVLADGMTFNPVTISPIDAQMIEQLKLSADIVCSVFGVPKHFVLGPDPTINNVEALAQQYYTQCLQQHIESMETLMDDALGLDTAIYSLELDLDLMMRMDTATRFKSYTDAIGGGWLSPNEARRKEGLRAVAGGDTPYLQQQNYSLQALGKRDSQDNPFGSASAAASQPEPQPNDNPDTVDTGSDSGDDINDAIAAEMMATFSQKLLETQ